jgi:hypothetical protein
MFGLMGSDNNAYSRLVTIIRQVNYATAHVRTYDDDDGVVAVRLL